MDCEMFLKNKMRFFRTSNEKLQTKLNNENNNKPMGNDG